MQCAVYVCREQYRYAVRSTGMQGAASICSERYMSCSVLYMCAVSSICVQGAVYVCSVLYMCAGSSICAGSGICMQCAVYVCSEQYLCAGERYMYAVCCICVQ